MRQTPNQPSPAKATKPVPYPRWATSPTGEKRIVWDDIEEKAVTTGRPPLPPETFDVAIEGG